ncbi:hypothetical protein ES703_11675 [subsurface metagenome]
MGEWPEPQEGSVFYEDEKLYACLAFNPIVKGHTIVAWREDVEDLNDLSLEDVLYLTSAIYRIRQALLEVYNIDKVYVCYLDEARHVHFHLFPREKDGEMGFKLLLQPHGELTDKDLSVVPNLRSLLEKETP